MFGIGLIVVSTLFVLILFIFIAGQGNTGTATTTTTTSGVDLTGVPATTVSGGGAQATQTMVAFNAETASLPRITAEEAKPAIMAGQVKVFDVREKSFYQTEHIKGAVNIPYTDAQTRVSEFPKTGDIILYCQ